jgi:iron complex transport system ATP-binding protein
MTLLCIESAEFGYTPQNTIFENVSLEVQPGEVMCIMGPNGCGKSTLVDAVLGVNKLRSGTISVGGRPLRLIKPREFAAWIAYVPQAHVKTFPYTVLDIILMGRVYLAGGMGAPRSDDFEAAREALAQVGMTTFADRPYTELSGGEMQLVMIARALAQNAKLFLMDEPTAHLDFRHELSVMEVVARLVKTKQVSVLMATHFLNQAFFLANDGVPTRVALMNNRRLEHADTPHRVLTEENLRRVFKIDTWIGNVNRNGTVDEIPRSVIVALHNLESPLAKNCPAKEVCDAHTS